MRPVNLIPLEERRGQRAANRTGPLVYVVLGTLGAILIGLALVVTTSSSISDRKAEREDLKAEKTALQAQSEALRNYAQFADLAQQREATVISLAHSRFDWERVMRELSLILPSDVWLIKTTASVSPTVTVEDDAAIGVRDSVTGPALELIGCGRSQDAVARFVAALRNLDGVTRVAVSKSERPSDSAQTDSAGSAGDTGDAASGAGDDCRTRDTIAKFEIVAAFDQAVVATTDAGAPGATPPAPTGSTGATGPTDGTGDAQQQQSQATQATNTATEQATGASQIVPGAGG